MLMVYTPNVFLMSTCQLTGVSEAGGGDTEEAVNLSTYSQLVNLQECQLGNLQESPKRVEEILKKLRSSRGSDKFEEWEV